MDRPKSCCAQRRKTSFAISEMHMENQLSVAIVGGTGNLGSALALRLGAPGVKIIIGSRDAEKAKKAVEVLKPTLRAGEVEGMTNKEAVKGAEFVVIAVPYEGHAQMVADLKGQLAGKIIIDTVVPLNKIKPFVPAAGSALQEAQQILAGEAPVVGALHNISAVDLGAVGSPLGDVLVCGDDAAAKQKVMEIIRRIGVRAFDGGPAGNAYVIEGLTGVIIHLNRKYKSKHGSIKITGIGE
jgi:8-hydroxy-5-deazaflavin:NADPH oxidoreductase